MSETHAALRLRWLELCATASLDGEAQWEVIASSHGEPDRAYHNLKHVRDCLEQLDQAPESPTDPLSLEFAIWFHDLIYDTHASDNEERSAEAAAGFLQDVTMSESVVSIILSTQHKKTPEHQDAQLMCDIDLSILGRDSTTYDRYANKIREEYAWVSEEDYRNGRRKVLQHFLNRAQLYSLPSFVGNYEEQARINLQQELAHLS